MPIYEFYCAPCNTVFSFFSSRIDTEKRPACPKCDRSPLERLVSKFAVLRGAKEQDDMNMPDLDESKLEKAMAMIEQEAGGLDEDDPKQAARLMRKLRDATGLDLGGGMEEALRRMEAGEDPDQIEAEMGDMLNEDDLFNAARKVSPKAGKRAPAHDETLYYL